MTYIMVKRNTFFKCGEVKKRWETSTYAYGGKRVFRLCSQNVSSAKRLALRRLYRYSAFLGQIDLSSRNMVAHNWSGSRRT